MRQSLLRKPQSASPPQSSTLSWVAAVSAAIVAIVLAGTIGVLLPLRAAASETALDVLEEQVANTTAAVSAFRASLYELAMNITDFQTNETATQAGTFEAVTYDSNTMTRGSPAATGTYALNNVQVGPLNFTLLELSMDAGQSINLVAFGASLRYQIYVDTFDPPLLIYGAGNQVQQDLSAANVAKLFIDDACLADVTCGYEAHEATTTFLIVGGTNTRIAFYFVAPDRVLQQDTALSFSSPLEILIATV